jgi:N-dimethylarginine dimethylaminohydrolase
MKPTVLVCPPTHFAVRDVKNPHMGGVPPVDHDRACRQWEEICRAFQRAGLDVTFIDPVPDLEDMVFAANQVFAGFHPKLGKFIVPSHMRHESRRREVPHYVEWFRQRHYRVIDLALEGEFLEGHGDLLWHGDHSRVWAGHGFRSTRGGVEVFAAFLRELGVAVTPLELVDPYFYHLDTCFSVLNAEAVLIFPGAFTPENLAQIRDLCPRVHEISRDDAMGFVCNGVVGNGCYLTPHLPPTLAAALSRENLQPVLLDTSEFEKSGGSAFCLKTLLP